MQKKQIGALTVLSVRETYKLKGKDIYKMMKRANGSPPDILYVYSNNKVGLALFIIVGR
jgi:hypothetical protein